MSITVRLNTIKNAIGGSRIASELQALRLYKFRLVSVQEYMQL